MEDPLDSRRDIYPWVPFKLVIEAHQLWRREDGLRAVLHWPDGSHLWSEARAELAICDRRGDALDVALDTAKDAWDAAMTAAGRPDLLADTYRKAHFVEEGIV